MKHAQNAKHFKSANNTYSSALAHAAHSENVRQVKVEERKGSAERGVHKFGKISFLVVVLLMIASFVGIAAAGVTFGKPVSVKPYKVDPVSGFKVASSGTNTISLSWDKDESTTEFAIYRSDEKPDGTMSAYKKRATVSVNSFTDKGLSQATAYNYKIYACGILDDYSVRSPEVTTSAMTKPEQVDEFALSERKTHSLKLNWTQNPRATGYVIQRSDEQPDGTFSEYKTVSEVNNLVDEYVDKKLSSGAIYRYLVSAKRDGQTITQVGDGVAARGMTKLSAPEKLVNSKSLLNSLRISWKENKFVDKYEVYRNKKLIKTVEKNKFSDKKLKTGSEYVYSVRAIRETNGKTYKSPFKSVKGYTTVKVPTVPGGLRGTWVQICIEKQTLMMYVDNKLYVKTSVVTGNPGGHDTTKGHHKVISRSSPARLRGDSWDVTVNYWLGFTSDGQGIHDSTWRSNYGGTIYRGNGSHGCVNTPIDAVKKVYAKGYVGMPVIVY